MNNFLSKNFQKDICISKCTFLCMPVSSILKAAGKPASPSHSVETHTLSLHIRHTEKRLIPDTERDDPRTSGATTIAFRPSETVSFPVYIQTGLSGKRSCPSSIRQPRLLYSPIRHLSGKGGKGCRLTTPPLLPLSSCVSFYASSVSLLQACPLSRLPVPGQ